MKIRLLIFLMVLSFGANAQTGVWRNFNTTGKQFFVISVGDTVWRTSGGVNGYVYDLSAQKIRNGFVQLNPISPQDGSIRLLGPNGDITTYSGNIINVNGFEQVGVPFSAELYLRNTGRFSLKDYFSFYINGIESLRILSTGIVLPNTPTTSTSNYSILTRDNTSGEVKQVNSNSFVTLTGTAPLSATDTGTTGEIRITAGYIYVCIATNTWVRSALTTW